MTKKINLVRISFLAVIVIIYFSSLRLVFAQPKELLYYTVFKDNKYTNYFSQGQVIQSFENATLPEPLAELQLEIFLGQKKHSVIGFGGSVTDSCLSNIEKLPKKSQRSFFKELFGKTHGANLSFLRLPIGANDFSASDYSFDEVPQGQTDPEFKKIDFTPAEPLIEFIKTAKRHNSKIQLMASPWSPPAWMKDTEKLRGGQILPQFYTSFAEYLAHTSLYLKSRKLPLKYLTILNEPLIGWAKESWGFAQTYMGVEDQQHFTKDYLIPTFAKMGVTTKVLIHDHNWDNGEGTIEKFKSLFEEKQDLLGGIAFHCYGGTYESQKYLLDKYKGTQFINSECSSTLRENDHSGTFQWWLRTQSLDSIQAGSSGALAWNLCLDQEGGPRNNGCRGCRGLVTVDSNKKSMSLNPEYLALKQSSKFLNTEAQVVENRLSQNLPLANQSSQTGQSSQTNEPDRRQPAAPTDLSVLTAINKDHSLVIVIRNPSRNFVKINIGQLKNSYILPPLSALSIKQ
jgi:glucosylceramidase